MIVLCTGTAVGQSRAQLESAAASIYGAGSVTHEMPLSLTDADMSALGRINGGMHAWDKVQVFRIAKDGGSGGVFMVDNVKGKSRPITYAVAFDSHGNILGIEILVYRESHGGEVRSESFRNQFAGKKHGDAIAVGRDIRNISGATISSRSVTNGAHALASLHHYLKMKGLLDSAGRK
jgi:electron transport complex protein RnfG